MTKDELKRAWMQNAEEMFELFYNEMIQKGMTITPETAKEVHSPFIDIVVPNLNKIADKLFEDSFIDRIWLIHGCTANGRRYLFTYLQYIFKEPYLRISARDYINELKHGPASGDLSFLQKMHSAKILFIDELQEIEKSAFAAKSLAMEMYCILKKGGRIFLSSKNADILAPFDLASILEQAKLIQLNDNGESVQQNTD